MATQVGVDPAAKEVRGAAHSHGAGGACSQRGEGSMASAGEASVLYGLWPLSWTALI